MMKQFRLVSIAAVAVLFSGCATMDKSECRTADWRMIGMEDGARGRPVTYVGNHRKACAEYGIRPDLDLYQVGHRNGVRQFCTPDNGFRQGRAGRGNNDVCPQDLRGGFMAGYDTGYELYQLNSEIRRMQSDVRNMQDYLAELQQQSQLVESRLVSTSLSSSERKLLLDEFKQLQIDIASQQGEVRNSELAAAKLQGEYDVLNSQHGYR